MEKKSLGLKKAMYKWATIDGLDPDVFAYWRNDMVTKEEYKKVKIKLYREEDKK